MRLQRDNKLRSSIIATILLSAMVVIFVGWHDKSSGQSELPPPSIKVEYDSEIDLQSSWPDKALEKAFRDYWSARNEKNVEKSWGIEAPHFRKMVAKEKYADFVNGFTDEVSMLKIRNIGYRNKRMVEIGCSLVFDHKKGRRRPIRFKDQWIYLDGKWYHVIKDEFMFQELA